MPSYKVLGFIFFLACGCSTPPNKFSDLTTVNIAEFQDRRQADSLIHYLLSKEPKYRIEAANALASVQDSTASMQLGTMLLEDPIIEARTAAAFALGQTNCTASANALIPALQDKEGVVLREVVEGLGKTIRAYDLAILKNFKAKDSLAQQGLAWAFYQLGLRGMADSIIVGKAMQLLAPNFSLQTRLGAAHFFSRSSKLKIGKGYEFLEDAALSDSSPFVRMAATSGLRKLDSAIAIPILQKAIADSDYRVRINAVRSLATFPSSRAQRRVMASLTDTNELVGVAASEAIKPMASLYDDLLNQAKKATTKRIQSNLYGVLLSLNAKEEVIQEIKNRYQISKSDYDRAQLLNSLANAPRAYEFVASEMLNSNALVVKTAGALALASMLQSAAFEQKWRPVFASIFQKIIEQGDPGALGIAAAALGDSTNHFKSTIEDYSFLQKAKAKLALPKDIETLQPLEEAIAYFEGARKPIPIKNEFNHPIDWKRVKTIDKNQLVKIQTAKGDIFIRLLVEEAPGSVANFVELANKKYFDGKFVHRVVPNFVIQTGCNRGDGFGSEDYSIRSEYSMRRYAEGSLGMASAGKDTEGTQWFITHSPTPHLNGRYTIFAEVISGMEAVHQLQIGDQILGVTLTN
jgi:cyclophilin family peptidyl-prolyl cis-trans isomerase/HEAT repeat protein